MKSADSVLPRLIALLRELYSETGGFLDRQDEAQLWYDRGYADGMAAAIRELGHGGSLPGDLDYDLDSVTRDLIAQQSLTPWGRAYAHGAEMGHDETYQVLEAA
ncbi:MAG: hypothetical protein WAM94_19570 [Chromatiaceae bacterium]